MKAPHALRRMMMPEGHFGHHGPCGRGPQGPGMVGHGPHGPGHHGPQGPQGEMAKGFGPCGHGPQGSGMGGHGPHGPEHHGPYGHKRRMRAFAQERMLETLVEQDKGIRQKELVEKMGINPSSVSELISKLEAEGYAVRTVDPDDKRATLITLTEVGKARAYELEDERKERFSKLFTVYTEKEKEQLLKLLEKLEVVEEAEDEE